MFLEISGDKIIVTENPNENSHFLMIPKLKIENKEMK